MTNEITAPTLSPMTIGLRVTDVAAALDFYERIGFQRTMIVPDAQGEPLFCALRYGGSFLVFDAVESELPFPATSRERNMKKGPRGLGVKVGLDVPDVEPMYHVFKETGCEITAEPMEQFWCECLFTAIDPFGYEWEFRQGFKQRTLDEQIAAARKAWVEEGHCVMMH